MSKALALALACHGVAAWTASDASIHSAVRLWLSDKSAAEVKYGHISTWETGGVTDMDFLFCVRTDWIDAEYEDEDNFLDPCVLPASASSFNDGISAWDTSSVTTMKLMFHGASAFNQPLNDWRVDKVTNMNGMFLQAAAFDQPLNDWWVDKVTSMVGMFHDALSFNQDISGWRVENVTNMYIMFAGARGFRQDLGWCVNDDVNMKYAFQKSRCEWTSCGVMQKKRYELEQCVYTGKSYTLLMVFVISFVGASLPVREIKILRPRCQSPAHWLNLAQVARGARGERRDVGGSLLPNASTLQRRGKRRRGNRDVGLISRYGVEFSRRDDPFDAPCIPNDSTTSKSL